MTELESLLQIVTADSYMNPHGQITNANLVSKIRQAIAQKKAEDQKRDKAEDQRDREFWANEFPG